MAKRGFGVLMAGIAFGAVAYLRDEQNRQKVFNWLNQTKSKVYTYTNQYNTPLNKQDSHYHNTLRDVAEAPASTSTLDIDQNAMVYEGGAQTTIFQYNEEQAESHKYH